MKFFSHPSPILTYLYSSTPLDKSPQSYTHSPLKRNYRLNDPEFSIHKIVLIEDKPVQFTFFHTKPFIRFDNRFIDSLKDFIDRITLPSTLDQNLLNKIGFIVHYLHGESSFEYQKDSAKQHNDEIIFFVINELVMRKGLISLKDYSVKYKDQESKKNKDG